jgi:hypothetical protein
MFQANKGGRRTQLRRISFQVIQAGIVTAVGDKGEAIEKKEA